MTTIPDTPNTLPANRFTPDAQERMAHLRSMAAAFPDEPDPRPLSSAEVRLARGTAAAALENAAVFVEAVPSVGLAVADVTELRDAIAFELAYAGVRDEARALARRVDQAIVRRKLKAARAARGVYRMAKGYITVDAGDVARPHVTEMRRSLRVRGRRKSVAAADPPTSATQ